MFAALVLAAGVDVWPALELHKVWWQPPPIYDAVAGQQVVLAEFPTSLNIPLVTNAVPFMYFSIWHGLPMINGYSGFTPPSYEPLMERLRDFPAPATIDLLRSRGVTHVTVNCALYVTGCEPILAGDQRVAGVSPRRRRPVGRAAGQTLRARPLDDGEWIVNCTTR